MSISHGGPEVAHQRPTTEARRQRALGDKPLSVESGELFVPLSEMSLPAGSSPSQDGAALAPLDQRQVGIEHPETEARYAAAIA